jgi:cell division inhibitor SulA
MEYIMFSLLSGLKNLFVSEAHSQAYRASVTLIGRAKSAGLESVAGRHWPLGVTELAAHGNSIELNALLPFMVKTTQMRKWIILVAPPYAVPTARLLQAGVNLSRYLVVNARSMEGRLWATEQALRSQNCGAVLVWPDTLSASQLARLQWAAEEGETTCFYFNSTAREFTQLKQVA